MHGGKFRERAPICSLEDLSTKRDHAIVSLNGHFCVCVCVCVSVRVS